MARTPAVTSRYSASLRLPPRFAPSSSQSAQASAAPLSEAASPRKNRYSTVGFSSVQGVCAVRIRFISAQVRLRKVVSMLVR